jgi:nucleoside-diphosphate-sugar epimerase
VSKPSVLVTGGTGFIGRRLIARLLQGPDEVDITCLALSPTTTTARAELDALAARGINVITGDLTRPEVSASPSPRADIVLHLAANIDTAATYNDLRVNDQGTEHLLDWIRPHGNRPRIVYTSSVAVLDRAAPATGALNEESPCTPRTEYGATKLEGERILKRRAEADGFSLTIARLGTIYGPGAKPGGLFESLCRLTSGSAMLARVNWPGRVSVMHVDDVADFLWTVARSPEAANQTYCAANAYAPTVTELAQRIGKLSGHTLSVVQLPNGVWSSVRTVIWNPAVRVACDALASQMFWRFSLLVDDAFWLDTHKMQTVWTRVPIDLDAGLSQMLSSMVEHSASTPV